MKTLIKLQELENTILDLNASVEQLPIQIKAIDDELSENKQEVENIESSITNTKKYIKI